MPISDIEGYSDGHFGRVYEHIIKPACALADFEPIRADDIITTNYIALDIIKHIISSEMAICDLSARNANVLYELGIRQAFNLPVTLIKDIKTNRVFDIQGFRDVEYDESLRIDSVQETIETLAETLKNTYENTHEVNSLVSLLGIEPAKITSQTKISTETELILNSISGLDKRIQEIEKRVQSSGKQIINQQFVTRNTPENIGEVLTRQDYENLKVGEKLYHNRFGIGELIDIASERPWTTRTGRIRFEAGEKNIVFSLAQMRKLK